MSFKSSVREYFRESGRLNKNRLKKMVLNAPFWFIVIALVLIGFGVCRILVLTDARPEQYMAEVWGQGGSSSYRQVSVFARGTRATGETSPMMYVDENTSLRKTDIPIIRQSLQDAVDTGVQGRAKGLNSDGSPKGWEDCYSTSFKASVSQYTESVTDITTPVDGVEIIGVGGNFKAFHPFRYLSGGFLPETVEDRYQVVLNDVLAWRFFNSYNVIGNKVTINGFDFTVVGVVEEGTSSVNKTVGATEPRAYIYFDTISIICTPDLSESGETSEDEKSVVAIQCYEAILPELVKGVAKTDIKNALPSYSFNDPQIYVVSNTGRFFITNVWDWVYPVGESSAKLTAYEFPYWEMAAQVTTDKIAIDAVLIAAGSVLLVAGTFMGVLRSRKFKKAVEKEDSESNSTEDSL